ncbi:MAG: Hsp20/alpha crystallin family protein [Gammaproteobacteria bacterium]|nr:Hsp20/alpha crystallin family protein [Gammaproteobacteria bacterium]
MKLDKLNPWNWFKHEEQESTKPVAVQRNDLPADPLSQLHRDMNGLFDRMWQQMALPGMAMGSGWPLNESMGMLKPSVDISSSEKEYTISVEVPGVEQEQLHLELSDNALIVRGEKQQSKEFKEKDMHRVERSYGSFQRTLSLPEDADRDEIDAQFKNGVLNITVPRKQAALSDGRHIDIRRAS